MNTHTELLEFPGGISIDYETELTKQFVNDRNSMKLSELVEKWKYVEPLMASPEVKVLDLMMPPMIMRFSMQAKKYGVNEGLIVLQMWNHDLITKDESGCLRLAVPEAEV